MQEEINLGDHLKVIYKYRFSIIGLTIIAVLITTVISIMMPKIYEASATLTIINPMSVGEVGETGEGTTRAEYSIVTYVNIIKNYSLLL